LSSTAEVLREVPLFRGMSDRTIETVSELARPGSFGAGDVLVRQGDAGDSFIVIRTGSATVTKDGQLLRELGAGDFLGEIALIDGGLRTATVTATSDIQALVIDRVGFSRLMNEFPVVRLDLVTALTQRLRQRAPEPTD
jgi:CRP-like cAMP-binding protein